MCLKLSFDWLTLALHISETVKAMRAPGDTLVTKLMPQFFQARCIFCGVANGIMPLKGTQSSDVTQENHELDLAFYDLLIDFSWPLSRRCHHHHHHRSSSFIIIIVLRYRGTHSGTKISYVSNMHAYTHMFNSLFSGTTWVSRQHKGKLFWILLMQEMMGGSGISWTICKSFAPHSRQITTPVPHHSIFFTGRMLFLTPNQQCQSTEGQVSKCRLNAVRLNTNRKSYIADQLPPSACCCSYLWCPSRTYWLCHLISQKPFNLCWHGYYPLLDLVHVDILVQTFERMPHSARNEFLWLRKVIGHFVIVIRCTFSVPEFIKPAGFGWGHSRPSSHQITEADFCRRKE